MLNKPSDILFTLIKSLSKAEKKNFKRYVTRNSSNKNLRTVVLFDLLDKMEQYEEEKVYRRYRELPRQQLHNIKNLLYYEILASLRVLSDEENITIKLNEQLDYARILYNKGLYQQSLRILEKVKSQALETDQLSHVHQCVAFEKKIESLHITRSFSDRASRLEEEALAIDRRLQTVSRLSDLSLKLYGRYIESGHASSEEEIVALRQFFSEQLPAEGECARGFYERLYYEQCYCWFKFILQDFFRFYRHAQRWVDLFEQHPAMKLEDTPHYIKGLHNLASAHFYLRNFKKHNEVIDTLEQLYQAPFVQKVQSHKVQVFIYLYTARINKYFMEGTFTEGLEMVPFLEAEMKAYKLFIDNHRLLVFYYKIACLYFGSGDNSTALDYLNKILNWKTNLRLDLQCYARLLHLIAHYELGNYELMEYLIKSVYRLMAKMNHLSVLEIEVFKFLRKSIKLKPGEVDPAFAELLDKLKQHQGNPLETRAFAYLDIMSWLESKLQKQPVQSIIREKFLKAGHK